MTRTYEFENLKIGDAYISGSVKFDAHTSNGSKTPLWDASESYISVDFINAEFTAFDTDALSRLEWTLLDKVDINQMAVLAIIGYGWEKFHEQLHSLIEAYAEKNNLWELVEDAL